MSKTVEEASEEMATRSGEASNDMTRDPSLPPPRLAPVLDPPPLSPQIPPDTNVDDVEQPPASLVRDCAPSQAPVGDLANYDQSSNGQLNAPCRQRGYPMKNTKAAPEARLAPMDEANKPQVHEN